MSIKLQKVLGVLALVGGPIDAMAESALRACVLAPMLGSFKLSARRWHITLVEPDELDALTREQICSVKANTRQIYPVGLGGNTVEGIYYVIVIWAAGQLIRKQLGLPPKQFHIILSSNDNHLMEKGIKSLLYGQTILETSLEFLDHLSYTLYISNDHPEAQSCCVRTIVLHPGSPKGFRRLGDSSLQLSQVKLAMLSYACAYQRSNDEKFKKQCAKKITECTPDASEWRPVIYDDDTSILPKEVVSMLLQPWCDDLLAALRDDANTTNNHDMI